MQVSLSGRRFPGNAAGRRVGWRRAILLPAALLSVSLAGCGGAHKPTVVLYSDQDRAVVEPLTRKFTQDTGLAVEVKYADEKAARSGVGLSERMQTEQAEPQGDVYWANDPSVAVGLINDGMAEHVSPQALDQMASPYAAEGPYSFAGLGARARVLLMNTRLVPKARAPKSFFCLALPAWKDRCAMADPRTNGSARYHVGVMFAALPEEEATEMLRRMKDNGVQFLPDEAAVAAAVADGKAAWGVVDSDVAEAAMRAGKPVRYEAADQETDSTRNALGSGHIEVPTLGTPILEEPLLLIARRPHHDESQQLYDYLISGQTALQLHQLQPACLPTHKALLEQPGEVHSVGALDPRKIKACVMDAKSVYDAHTKVALALAHVFGSASP